MAAEEVIPFVVPSVEDVCSMLRAWQQALQQHRASASERGWDAAARYKQNKIVHFGLVRVEQLAAVGDYPLKSAVMREVGRHEGRRTTSCWSICKCCRCLCTRLV